MAYAKSEETRQKLVKTTSKLIRTQGYTATGISQIIAESGVPKGSLYHHFPAGKSELAAAAVRHSNDYIRNRLRELVSVTDHPAQTIEAFCNYYIDALQKTDFHHGCPIATITLEVAASEDSIQTECAAGFELIIALFHRQLMEHGMAADSAESQSILITAAIEGALIVCRAMRSTKSLEVVRDRLSAQVRRSLDASP